jgi:signal transduction histidine kinase
VLEQALLNLLRNAIEAIPADGTGEVRIEADAGAAGVVISVEDNGAGFSEVARKRMFEPFFTTKASGTGIGLAITRSLVSSLGGELEIRARDTGGTTAIIKFPNVKAPKS